jgi:hypothetical protein
MKKLIINENYKPAIEVKPIENLDFFGGNYNNFEHEDILYIRDKYFKRQIQDKVKSWISKNEKMCYVKINGKPLIQTYSGFLGQIIIFGAKISDTRTGDLNIKIKNFGQGAMTEYYINCNLVHSKYKIYPGYTGLKINY